MTRAQQPHRQLEIQARYVLLAPLAEDRRVLDIDSDVISLSLLAEAGATELTATTSNPSALSADLQTAEIEGVEVVPDLSLPLNFEEDAFDLVICHDLGEQMIADSQWIEQVRRVLSPTGYLVLTLATPEGQFLSDLLGQRFTSKITYEDAFERLSDTFGILTTIAQSPLAANVFWDVESEEEEPDLGYDRSLLEDDEEPGWYVLVFGPEAVHRDDLTIVQVPFSSLAQAVLGADRPALPAAAPVAAAAVADGSEIEALHAKITEIEADRDAAATELQLLRKGISALKAERLKTTEELDQLRQQASQPAPAAAPAQEAPAQEAPAQTVPAQEAPATDDHAALMRERIKGLKIEQRAQTEKINKLRERLLKLETESAEAAAQLPMLRERIKALKIERRVEQEKLNKVRERNLKAEAERDEALNVMPLLRERIKALKIDRRVGLEKLNNLRARNLKTEAERDEAVAQLPMLRERIKALKIERRVEQEKLNKVREKILQLESQLQKGGAADQELASQLPLLQERVKSLVAARDKESQTVSHLRLRVMELEDTRQAGDDLSAKLTAATARRDELEQEAARNAKDRQSFESQIKDLLEEVTQSRDSAEAAGAASTQVEALKKEREAQGEAVRQREGALRGAARGVGALALEDDGSRGRTAGVGR